MSFPAAACTLINAAGVRVCEPGAFELRIGPSSDPRTQLRTRFQIG